MSDYIDREKLIAEYDRVHIGAPGGARKLMVDAPAEDVVPVVRCCQCEHLKTNINKAPYCDYHSTIWEKFYVRLDDFCSYGERKNDNG